MANLRAKAKIININPLKVAIYVRWSTDEQGEGTTLTIQLERCKQFILSQGWTINEDLIFIDDGYSGGTLERPEIKKLCKAVDNDLIDCVVIFKLDRLSRSIVDTVNLVLSDWDDICYIKSVTEPFDTTQQIGRQILTMLAGFAEWERYNIKLRTFEGKIETVEKGRSPGITPPYGYVVGDKTGTFKTIEHEANIVRRIFREYKNGKGIRTICAMLNSEGVPFRDSKKNINKKWNTNTIAYMLSNQLYIGKLVYGKQQANPKHLKKEGEPWRIKRAEEDIMVKELTEDVIIPIITFNEFNLVQKIKKSRNVFLDHLTSGKKFDSPHLLSGLLKCSKCGYGLTARGQQKGDNHAYYFCRGNKMKGVGFCDAGYIRQDELDKIVEEDFVNYCLSQIDSLADIKIEQNESRILELNNSVITIDKSLNDLEKEFETIKIKLRRDNLDVNTFNMLKNDIEKESDDLKKKRQFLVDEVDKINESKIDKNKIDDFIKKIKIWDNLTLKEKKQILSTCIDHIDIFKNKSDKQLFFHPYYFTNLIDR